MLQARARARARTRSQAADACGWAAQVFVFDTRRGTREGEELEKVLSFFPAGVGAEQQQARARACVAARGAARAVLTCAHLRTRAHC